MSQTFSQLRWSLKDLLSEWLNISDENNALVTGISEYSGDVTHGDLFLAISGSQYCDEAITNGAVAILYDDRFQTDFEDKKFTVPVVEINDLHKIVSDIVLRFYEQGISKIKTVAITGTDGKTSVAHLTAQALEHAGDICGLVGTLGYGRITSLKASTHTTPPTSRLAKEFHQLEECGCDVVAVEASSHGIAQNRLQNINVHTAVLTNITRDHLDYHQTIENYIQSKAKLFFDYHPKSVVINIDDATGRSWCDELQNTSQVITYSITNTEADIYAIDVEYHTQGMKIVLSIFECQHEIAIPLLGSFNVLNVLAVISILISLDKKVKEIISAIENIQAVPGRMQIVKNDLGISVVVDFAHTPAALFAAMNAMREHCHGNLICVFGCGGDRDKGKRPEMGNIVTQFAEQAIITSDNPRSENPQVIIDDIINGCTSSNNFTVIIDRRDAIAHALKIAQKNDAILIAGKGHEKTQQIGQQMFPFDDVMVVSEEIARIKHG